MQEWLCVRVCVVVCAQTSKMTSVEYGPCTSAYVLMGEEERGGGGICGCASRETGEGERESMEWCPCRKGGMN